MRADSVHHGWGDKDTLGREVQVDEDGPSIPQPMDFETIDRTRQTRFPSSNHGIKPNLSPAKKNIHSHEPSNIPNPLSCSFLPLHCQASDPLH